MKMWNSLPFLFLLASSSSRINFASAQEKLRTGLSGSKDFAYEGPISNEPSRIIVKPTTTTVAPEFQQCVDTCLAQATITDVRPICGSDHVTYSNNEHFNCAVQCGKLNINKLYTDKCNQVF